MCFLVNYQFNQTLLTQRRPRNHLCLDFIKYTSVSCAAKQTGTLSAGDFGRGTRRSAVFAVTTIEESSVVFWLDLGLMGERNDFFKPNIFAN